MFEDFGGTYTLGTNPFLAHPIFGQDSKLNPASSMYHISILPKLSSSKNGNIYYTNILLLLRLLLVRAAFFIGTTLLKV